MFLFLFISLTLWMWILSLKVCIIVTVCICFVFCIYHDCSTTSILHPLLHFVNWTIWTNIFGIYFSVYVFFVCSGSIRWIRANVMSGQKYQFISCFCCVNCFPFFFLSLLGSVYICVLKFACNCVNLSSVTRKQSQTMETSKTSTKTPELSLLNAAC